MTLAEQQPPHIWLRAETKKNEKRTALTPKIAQELVKQGFQVTIECSEQSIFDDAEYISAGIDMVAAGSWKQAPKNAYIYGLKELPEQDESPLVHKHIMFAHCYKQQAGWKDVLHRFIQGQGLLLDLEFLTDAKGRRVAAFGYYAGFAGSAVGLDVWCHRVLKGSDVAYPRIEPYAHQDDLIRVIKEKIAAAYKITLKYPKILVIGALGRCGTGACDFAVKVGIPAENLIRWDMAETSKGGPFEEILQADIFVNCIYLSQPISPFLTLETVQQYDKDHPGSVRPLSVLVDVSCDATNPHNPIPVYYGSTTFDQPLVRVCEGTSTPLDVIAIDHLPTLLPREASEFFARDLLPCLLALKEYQPNTEKQPMEGECVRVWRDAEHLFYKHCKLVNEKV